MPKFEFIMFIWFVYAPIIYVIEANRLHHISLVMSSISYIHYIRNPIMYACAGIIILSYGINHTEPDWVINRLWETSFTRWTKSRAAMVSISAQETTPGHLLSTNAFAFVMVSNPSALRSLLSTASLSANALLPCFVAIRIDPSHPYSQKWWMISIALQRICPEEFK